MIIQIIGLPGSGKTTLASNLTARTNAIHLNADAVRADLSSDLGFTAEDRVEQARRLGAMARLLDAQGHLVIVDWIAPTEETRKSFGKFDYRIHMDTITEGRFPDTNKIWERPKDCVLAFGPASTPEDAVEIALKTLSLPDWKAPTTLMLGRYQPWHEGHQALMEKAHERTEQVLIAVRDTHGTSEKDPLTYQQVAGHIVSRNARPFIMKVPNITNIVYGRDVGYKIEQVDLGEQVHSISATQKRKEMGL